MGNTPQAHAKHMTNFSHWECVVTHAQVRET